MKYVDEFRDGATIRALSEEIHRLADPGRTYRIMEVCGGHTHAIFRFGLNQLLPDNVELVHGPGCPVCVLPMGRMDEGLAMAEHEGLIFTAFGDMMRVPGGSGSLLDARARGADVVLLPFHDAADRAVERLLDAEEGEEPPASPPVGSSS